MIERIVKIKNVGKYLGDFRAGGWDGTLKKNTIIYAPNGSGKTTLALIFESLNEPPGLLGRKLTFQNQLDKNDTDQKISLKIDGKIVECLNGVWKGKTENVEVFGIHFIENNLFSGSKQFGATKHNLFSLISGIKGQQYRAKLKEMSAKADEFKAALKPLKRLKKQNPEMAMQYRAEILKLHVAYQPFREERRSTYIELGRYSQERFESFITEVNKHLQKFSSSMRLAKISSDLDTQTTFSLEIDGNKVVFDSLNGSYQFQYTLSEGDKNALAISIFLAKISLLPTPENCVIVFDDPLSSFDAARRALTVRELFKLSNTFGQLILLTHDAAFAADMEQKIFTKVLSLEINSSSGRSMISHRNHQAENITPYFRDIFCVKTFLAEGAKDEIARREVARCLRPILEGVIRFKYFEIFSKNQWLGNFIDMVRESKTGDDLFHLTEQQLFDDLTAINDYTKGFHHSSPDVAEESLNNEELRIMVKKTLKLVRKI